MSNKFPKSINKFCNLTTEEEGCIWVGQPPSQPTACLPVVTASQKRRGRSWVGTRRMRKPTYAYISCSLSLLLFLPSIYLPLLRMGTRAPLGHKIIHFWAGYQSPNSSIMWKGSLGGHQPHLPPLPLCQSMTSLLGTCVTWWEWVLYEYSYRPYSDVPQSTGWSAPCW